MELLGRRNLRAAVAGRALEALQTAGGTPDCLARAAAAYLDSEDPETAASAVIASLPGNEAGALGIIKSLVLSEDPARRQAGAHCLGHHQSEASLKILFRLATRDPDSEVRRQAVTSFGWYPLTPPVRDHLLALLSGLEPALTPLAAGILARREASSEAAVAEALIGAAERARGTQHARPLLAVLGRLRHRTAAVYLNDQVRVRTDSEELIGLLDAIDAQDVSVPSAVGDLTRRGPARVRATAARLLWNAGEPLAVDVLLRLLDDSTVPETFEATLTAVEELAIASVKLADLPRFQRLKTRAAQNLKTAGYQDFAASDLSLDVPRELRQEAYDPDGAMLDQSSWHEGDAAGLLGVANVRVQAPAAASRKPAPRQPALFPTDELDARAPARRAALWAVAVVLATLAALAISAWALLR